jgi:hypothetical protein
MSERNRSKKCNKIPSGVQVICVVFFEESEMENVPGRIMNKGNLRTLLFVTVIPYQYATSGDRI